MEGITNTAQVSTLVLKLNTYVFNPIIGLLFGVAFVMFLWGVAEYIWQSDSQAARETGSRHIIWGILGMVIMFGAFAIVRIIAGSLGVSVPGSI